VVNYAPVTALTRDESGFLNGVVSSDLESGEEIRASAKVVINATGAFSDQIRRQADPDASPMIAASQGIHLVFDRSFLPGDSAIMVPHTSDGRVMFAIPWHKHTLVGTTDTPIPCATLEPVAKDQEIDFILTTASQYLAKKPSRDDVLSVFAGIRPLVKSDNASNTAALSRDHVIHIDKSGLMTICGGKWTTYRHMAQDCITQAATLAQLPEKACVTEHLNIHGFHPSSDKFGDLAVYGSDAPEIQKLGFDTRLHPALPYTEGEIVWAARHEMARTVEDMLARRTRALFLNARAAMEMAPRIAELMAAELGRDESWRTTQVAEFMATAGNYLL
jgi:glycerol-3-phosphate dehydrogenase